MMKPVEFVVEDSPVEESVNECGEYVFGLYTSSHCDDELEATIRTMVELWSLETLDAEVSLTINVRLRSVFEQLFEYHAEDGGIEPEYKPLFDAMKKDAQWIVDQINKLENQGGTK